MSPVHVNITWFSKWGHGTHPTLINHYPNPIFYNHQLYTNWPGLHDNCGGLARLIVTRDHVNPYLLLHSPLNRHDPNEYWTYPCGYIPTHLTNNSRRVSLCSNLYEFTKSNAQRAAMSFSLSPINSFSFLTSLKHTKHVLVPPPQTGPIGLRSTLPP